MKKVLITILIGLLIFPTNLVSAVGANNDKERASGLSRSIEEKTGVSDIIKSKLNEDLYTDNTKINLPSNGTDHVKVSDLENKTNSFEMLLPKEANNTNSTISTNGTIVYNNEVNSNANVALQPTNDGFRSLVIINNLSASKDYTFEFILPKGSRLITAKEYLGSECDTKEVFVVNKDNVITSLISPPWAKDANGSNVPTYYRVEGNKVIQVVEFTKNNVFPIVADPSAWKITKCIGAIGAMGITLAVPIAKIAKIRKFIKVIGSVKEAAMLLTGATSAAEKSGAVRAALKNLIYEISGIAGVISQCRF
ncbi:hypothetical protein KPL47_19350 [Clostridium estertheticum]|uniref:hypothetical protein n=1 Tax=Clostridium estertheticum TaxID=238834 RepID=UPI001C0DEF2D|nr:hypothetical protein [Clostridium estertheticum]MBU3178482.1 hypothetical protein [Clostridium estertheticum]